MGRVRAATLCSRNEHKARELERLLPGWTIDVLCLVSVGGTAPVSCVNNLVDPGEHFDVGAAPGTAGVACSATCEDVGGKKAGANRASAEKVGKAIAERLLSKKVDKVIFDRGGFLYHGKVKALADAAREGGLKF